MSLSCVFVLLVMGEIAQDLPAPPGVTQTDRLITQAGIGPVKLGMTLNEARRALPRARFSRTSDGDGAALVEVSLGPEQSLVARTGEDDAAAPIDWTRKIEGIETTSPGFRTAEGIHPGMPVSQVEALFGPVRQIVRSEIESREFISFERQPSYLVIRLDYTAIFPAGRSSTREYRPGAKILSIAVSVYQR